MLRPWGAVIGNARGALAALVTHPGFRRNPPLLVLRCVLWVGHCALRRPARVRLRSGAVLEVPPKLLRSGSGAIYVFRDDYEPELAHLGSLLGRDGVFVDGGANVGIYTAAASKLVGPGGRVLSCEPAAGAFSSLSRNVGLSADENVRAFNVALSDTSGEAPLFHANGGPVGYSLGGDTATDTDYETVRTARLDEIVDEAGVDRVDVIKLDVEGAEEVALRGAQDVLRRYRPTVLFELQPQAPTVAETDHQGAWALLDSLGYRLFTMGETGQLVAQSEPRVGNNIAVAG